ncbi:MAG: GNAT family N-acetyltransferase [Dehalococcoidia bacterium]
MSEVSVRRATLADSETLIRLMEGLAAYEKLTPPDEAAKERFRAHLAEGKRFEAVLAEASGEAIGYALYFESYSTFRANPKLYMEDIFVEPAHRKSGAGFALFKAVVKEADRRGCVAVEWQVLDWNQLAIGFYERVGGRHEKQWPPYTLGRAEMDTLLDRHSREGGNP